MSEERQRILRMLKDGKLTVEEAEALLEALGEAQIAEAGSEPQAAAAGAGPVSPAEAGTTGAGPAAEAGGRREQELPREEAPAGPRAWRSLVEDIIESVNVEGIAASVRESLRQARPDIERLKEGITGEVRQAIRQAREEARRAAEEARRQFREHRTEVRPPHPPRPSRPLGVTIAAAIEGLWGLSGATAEWSAEADVPAGKALAVENIWGDVTVDPSPDGRVHARARIRAWGRDPDEARGRAGGIPIRAGDRDGAYVIAVEPPASEFRSRFRVDFEIEVPEGVAVRVNQAKGDVRATRLAGDLSVRIGSGDVSAEDVRGAVSLSLASGDVALAHIVGPVHVETASGDGSVEHVTGDVVFSTSSGDVTLSQVSGRAQATTRGGDVHLEHVGGDAEVRSYGGDIDVDDVGGTVSVTTYGGDVTIERVHGPVAAHTKGGDLSLRRPAGPVSLDLTTLGGDVDVEVERFLPGSASVAKTASGDVTILLGPEARCRISARTVTGSVDAAVELADVQRTRRSVEGVYGAAEATLEVSTAAGDVSIARGR